MDETPPLTQLSSNCSPNNLYIECLELERARHLQLTLTKEAKLRDPFSLVIVL